MRFEWLDRDETEPATNGTARVKRLSLLTFRILLLAPLAMAGSLALGQSSTGAMPWMDRSLSPDRRAELVLKQMTLDEKLQLVHGTGWGVLRAGAPVPAKSNRGAGYIPGILRLGIPDINQADSAVGVRMAAPESRYATLLPSVLGLAASWDTSAAHLYGEVIGRELRDQGFNMSIGGGVDLMREPRNGRNFEYAGEDPVLAGTMVGQLAMGVQSQHVMGDIKHYALNDQETGRGVVDVRMSQRTMRETDLLAFQIAIEMAQPAGVMCSYNLVNGEHACDNDYLLNHVLKRDFGFKGWVLSDWEATHSTVKAANAGLDQEMPGDQYFGAALKSAIAEGKVPLARLDDMDFRILRSMFAAGVVDDPPARRVVDPFRGQEDAQHIEEESIVLVKNAGALLPLHAASIHRIAIIGGHADVGVLSGGGSAQVDAPGGNAIGAHEGASMWGRPVYFPSSPMKAIEKLAPDAAVSFSSGTDIAAASQLAKSADVAIVFATQFMMESVDTPSLSLPDKQDALIAAIAAANPHTIVVLETGGPVSMPWDGSVGAVLESWYPGIGGGQAIANILFGAVNPSGKLPATFARTDADLPLPRIAGMTGTTQMGGDNGGGREIGFELNYPEGVAVGYRWFELKHIKPLYAFGHGLSYTSFSYSGLKTDAANRTVQFQLSNTGAVAGTEIAQVYVTLPASSGEPFQRLAGWQRLTLKPGESRTVTVALDPAYLSIYDEAAEKWTLLPGEYQVVVGPSSDKAALTGNVRLP
jgi:beta-glucosidase